MFCHLEHHAETSENGVARTIHIFTSSLVSLQSCPNYLKPALNESVSLSIYTTFMFSMETVNKVAMVFCDLDCCFRSRYLIT